MEVFIGTIQMFGFNFAPTQWALCNGQLIAIQQNTALFSLLGTTYGGNGTTNFQLPNLQSRLPIGMGQGPGLSNYVQGEMGGIENVTLLGNNLPAHNHSVTVNLASTATNPATVPSNTNNYLGASGGGQASAAIYSSAQGNNPVALAGASTGMSGNNAPVEVMNPYLALNFSIALYGIFPSRN